MAKLYTWGNNSEGGLAQGDTTNRSVPTQVGSQTDWVAGATSGGQRSPIVAVGVRGAGSAWSWGYNAQGQLAANVVNNTKYSSPIQVGALTGWTYVSPGYNWFGIRSGQLFSAGYGAYGQLGLFIGGVYVRSSPVLVPGGVTWSKVCGGIFMGAGIDTSGYLWTWGKNNVGQLGLGDTTNRSSPVKVGSNTNWKQIALGKIRAFCIAVTTDGKLFCWGDGQSGNIGNSTVGVNYSSPVQVPGTTWASVSCSSYSVSAIKTDGTLWQWGAHGYGEGPATSNSAPAQTGAATDWKKVSGGHTHILGLKTTGKLYAWGQNNVGQLGLGNTTNYTTPQQVGSSILWTDMTVFGPTNTALMSTAGPTPSMGWVMDAGIIQRRVIL